MKISSVQKRELSQSFFGTASNSIFFKLSTVPAMVFVSCRFLVCALVFLAAAMLSRCQREEQAAPLSPKTAICLFATGFVFSLGAFAYFVALKETALSSVLILNSSNAIFVVCFSAVFLRERLNPWVVLSIGVTLVGCTIVFLDKAGWRQFSERKSVRSSMCSLRGNLYDIHETLCSCGGSDKTVHCL